MLSFIMVLLLAGNVQAQNYKNSTTLYEPEAEPEAEEKTETFSAKVRVIRDAGESMDVFFISDKQKGAYSLSRSSPQFAAALKALEDSRKPKGGPLSITAKKDKTILKVEPPSQQSGFQVPSDPNEKWDFGKIAD